MKNKLRKLNYMKTVRAVVSVLSVFVIVKLFKKIKLNTFITFSYIPSIQKIWIEFTHNIKNPAFFLDIAITVKRVYSGFILASILAIIIALLISLNKRFKEYIFPVIELLRPIPNVAWVPISILLFKTNDMSILFITFVGAFFPVLMNSFNGFENIDQRYTKIAKSFKTPKGSYILNVMIPAAAPGIVTGLMLGMSGSWLGVVVAEMISGQSGIGYLTWTNYTLTNIPGVIVCMCMIGVLGALSSWFIRSCSQLLHIQRSEQ